MESSISENYIKHINLKNSIYNIPNYDIEINISSNNTDFININPNNRALVSLLYQRKLYAMTYIDSNLKDENKKIIEEAISKLNEEIIKIIGLYTL